VRKLKKYCCKFPGCEFKHTSADSIKEHEENECQNRSVQCGHCDASFQLHLLPEHLIRQQHASWDERSQELSAEEGFTAHVGAIVKDQWHIEVTNSDEKLNFFENWVEVEDGFFIYWISSGGPKKEASKFKYTLKIQSSEDREKCLYECKTYCVPCDISHQEMKNRKEGILISKKVIEAAVDEDEQISCTLTIGC